MTPIQPGARVEIHGGFDDIPDGTYGTILLTPGQNDSIHYMVRCQDADGVWRSANLRGSVLTDLAGEALERELRLDEERIAAEMEWESVRGISAPDF